MTTSFDPKAHLLPCPFSVSCILPKNGNICKFPGYKVCPEYQIKEKKMKPHLIH
ncbi:MAG: hypothetical protein KGD57_04285 [Candidatus Lokiarchaeota archaeon]|nr:hypothetical protein [Candidatus Lokiarchaeota archaeon]